LQGAGETLFLQRRPEETEIARVEPLAWPETVHSRYRDAAQFTFRDWNLADRLPSHDGVSGHCDTIGCDEDLVGSLKERRI